jgi:hypothetical protein
MFEYGPLPYASPLVKVRCAVPQGAAALAVFRGPADAVAEPDGVGEPDGVDEPDAVGEPGALPLPPVAVPEGAVAEVPLPAEPLPEPGVVASGEDAVADAAELAPLCLPPPSPLQAVSASPTTSTTAVAEPLRKCGVPMSFPPGPDAGPAARALHTG